MLAAPGAAAYPCPMFGIASLVALLLASAAPPAAGAEPPHRAKPVQTLAALFTDEDYPAEAIRNREQGRVGFRLEVAADGRPSGCSVVGSSGSSALDSTTCRLLMERARFTPARDSRGGPTTDSFVGGIVWRLGETNPRLEAAHRLWTTCVIGEASKLAPGDLPASEVIRRAFPPCSLLERLIAQEIERDAPLEDIRAALTAEIEKGLDGVRAELNAAPKSGTEE